MRNSGRSPGTPAVMLEPISVRIREAVALTGFSRSRLYELIALGEIEIVKDGRSTLVIYASLRAAVEQRRLPGSSL